MSVLCKTSMVQYFVSISHAECRDDNWNFRRSSIHLRDECPLTSILDRQIHCLCFRSDIGNLNDDLQLHELLVNGYVGRCDAGSVSNWLTIDVGRNVQVRQWTSLVVWLHDVDLCFDDVVRQLFLVDADSDDRLLEYRDRLLRHSCKRVEEWSRVCTCNDEGFQ